MQTKARHLQWTQHHNRIIAVPCPMLNQALSQASREPELRSLDNWKGFAMMLHSLVKHGTAYGRYKTMRYKRSCRIHSPFLQLQTQTLCTITRHWKHPTAYIFLKQWRRRWVIMKQENTGNWFRNQMYQVELQSFLLCGPWNASAVSKPTRFTSGKQDSTYMEGNRSKTNTIARPSPQ